MNIDAFRCMRHGIQLLALSGKDRELLGPIEKTSVKAERALLLIHGFSSTPAVYRKLLPSLTHYYDGIYCPVLPGHSQDIDSFAKVKASQWLSLVEETYQSLAARFIKVDVMGLSLGGLLACHLSKRYALNHLYLLAPAIELAFSTNYYLKLAKLLNWLGFRKLRAAAGNLFTSENYEIAYRQLPLTSIIEVLTLIHQFEFSSPTCPTDLFLGYYDGVVSSKRVEERFLDLENINIHWLSNSAHVLPLDGDISTILACIKRNAKS